MVETKSIIISLKNLQDDICQKLENLDGVGRFQEDIWTREEGGGGRTRIIHGKHIEKGGVNFSHVYGTVTPMMKEAMKMKGEYWLACGVSIVLHPVSPMVPIIHMNVRYFELDEGKDWWFGGGIDLTPHYIDLDLAKKFHVRLKKVCDSYSGEAYSQYKKWADEYFFLPHRNETRGIGGIFFDHLNDGTGKSKDDIFKFVMETGQVFIPAYQEQLVATVNRSYGKRQKEWQMIRRGRYVEFNLAWDRGTRFGLMSNGRAESILMSLPPQANWIYQYDPSGDQHAMETLSLLKKDVKWI